MSIIKLASRFRLIKETMIKQNTICILIDINNLLKEIEKRVKENKVHTVGEYDELLQIKKRLAVIWEMNLKNNLPF